MLVNMVEEALENHDFIPVSIDSDQNQTHI